MIWAAQIAFALRQAETGTSVNGGAIMDRAGGVGVLSSYMVDDVKVSHKLSVIAGVRMTH